MSESLALTRTRPCKDGRHEILADCRRSVFFFFFFFFFFLPSSSRAKQGFCSSRRAASVVVDSRAVPFVCHMQGELTRWY